MVSITRLFRLGIRIAAWATPHVKEWQRQRNLNVTEAERNLAAKNWSEAERYLTFALAETRHSAKRRLDLTLKLVEAQCHQCHLEQADQTVRGAIDAAANDTVLRSRALTSLVDVQLGQKKYDEVEQTIREIDALECARQTPDRARLAVCARKLGTAYLSGGRTAEALAALQHAAHLSEKAFGPNHENTAQSFAELGMLSRQHGEHAEAQRCLRKALEIHRVATGDESRESTQALYHLAASLEESGDLDGAAGEYERMLRLKDRQVGGNRQEATDVQVRLAAIYVKAGKIAPARELLMNAIGALERKGGAPLAQALEIFAEVEDCCGHPVEAQQWRERAAEIAGSAC